MDDLVTRLRRWTHAADAPPASDLLDEAAAEIERLRGYRDAAESEASIASLAVERLLERTAQKLSESDSLCGGSIKNDTPRKQTTQSEGSLSREGTSERPAPPEVE